MKAIIRENYGLPDVLAIKEVDKPVVGDNEVLVKVYATSVNASDWELLRGKPLYARIYGLFKPGYKILGSDIAGCVEAVGRKVKQFQPGDEVFGDIFECWGGFAEFVSAPENALMLKPADMTFEQASVLPQAAIIALQGLGDKGKIQAGQQVLINGAGGGAGSFALQIAKSFGAEVTAVDSARKLEMMRAIGADYVIDYAKEDFTQNGQCYDRILDFMACHSLFDYKRVLKSGGIYTMVGGSMARLFQLLLLGPLVSMTGSRKMGILAWKRNISDLLPVIALIKAGEVVPVIDKCFPLSEVAQALSYLGEGQALGKVVINVQAKGKSD